MSEEDYKIEIEYLEKEIGRLEYENETLEDEVYALEEEIRSLNSEIMSLEEPKTLVESKIIDLMETYIRMGNRKEALHILIRNIPSLKYHEEFLLG